MLGYVKWILIVFAVALAGAILYRVLSGDMIFSDDFLRVLYRFYLTFLYGVTLFLAWKIIGSGMKGWSIPGLGKSSLSAKTVRLFGALPQVLAVLTAMVILHAVVNFILFGNVRMESFWQPPW